MLGLLFISTPKVQCSNDEISHVTSVGDVLDLHRASGTFFDAGGVRSFVRTEGSGEPVVLIHGLPASSFLFRKVIGHLANQGLRGIAFDLPGLGFADRPTGFDYSLAGLGTFAEAAVDALGLDRFHLVVHDAGGPVGFDLVARDPGRIRSLTVTNTVVELSGTHFPGEVLARGVQRVPNWLDSEAVWRFMMVRVGILDRSEVSDAEVDAYRALAMGNDRGAGYLRIMRGLGDQRMAPVDYRPVLDVTRVPYPVQIIWGADDPILRLRWFGWRALAATGLATLHALPARHFLHEDQAAAVADLVAGLAAQATDRR